MVGLQLKHELSRWSNLTWIRWYFGKIVHQFISSSGKITFEVVVVFWFVKFILERFLAEVPKQARHQRRRLFPVTVARLSGENVFSFTESSWPLIKTVPSFFGFVSAWKVAHIWIEVKLDIYPDIGYSFYRVNYSQGKLFGRGFFIMTEFDIKFRAHAIQRMFERSVSEKDIHQSICEGEIILSRANWF